MTTSAEPARYPEGTSVRARTGSVPRHFRAPAYIQGHTGVVDALCGVYPNSESPAHGCDGLANRSTASVEE